MTSVTAYRGFDDEPWRLALAFANAEIRIIPVRLFLDRDRWRKRPHITEWRRRASNDPDVVAEWWREFPDAAVGIVLEHYGHVVVDCDRHGRTEPGPKVTRCLDFLSDTST
jgi:hypothetical protein